MSRKVLGILIVISALALMVSEFGFQQRMTHPSSPKNVPVYPVRQQTITSDTDDFADLTAGKCTDKTRVHRYQELYARALHGVRSTHTPVRLLEVGLGCYYRSCAAGGAKAFMHFLPHGQYHSLEINVTKCKIKYKESDVSAALASYVDEHLCPGSSVDPDVIESCSNRFGPFDIVIDDASHMHKHTTAAFRLWFTSPFLVAGGTYIVEDMQSVSQAQYDLQAEGPPLPSHPASRGGTFMNYAQNIFFCKLAGMFCSTPSGGLPQHSMGVYVPHVSEIVMARESTILRKRGIDLAQPQVFASHDVIVALSTAEQAVYARPVHVLVLRQPGAVSLPQASDDFLRSKFPYGIVNVEGDLNHDGSIFSKCITSRVIGSSCIVAALAKMEAANVKVDLVWIETSASSDRKSWGEQKRIVEVIAALLPSPLLQPHGVIAINGYQSRRAAFEADDRRRPSGEPASQGNLAEPILRFLLDVSTSMLCCRPGKKYNPIERARLPYPAVFQEALKVRNFAGDISLDDRGTVYIRKMHPRSQ